MTTLNRPLPLFKSVKKREVKILPYQCRICGAPAGYHCFGILACQSCKMFFKRNAIAKQKAFTCNYDGQCDINSNNRHVCASCRLAKCFQCGMTIDRFRASRCDQSKSNVLVKVHEQHRPKLLPSLHLFQPDQSLLSSHQWTLLSNLCNSYKESQLLAISQRLKNTHAGLQSTHLIYQELVQEFLASIYETTGTYLRLNHDLCQISTNDRSLTLHNAADNVSCMGFAFVAHHCHLFALEAFSNAMINMYGKRSVDMHLWARKFIDSDIVLTKLALALFAVSGKTCSYPPNVPANTTDSISIFQIQNKYAEVTWKYLLYKYSYDQAVKRFLNLTSWLMALTIFMYHAQSLVLHVNDLHSLVEQMELTLILDDVDQLIQTNQYS